MEEENAAYYFTAAPAQADYLRLAAQIEAIDHDRMHPALWPEREEVAARFRAMAAAPERPAHRACYEMMRLMLW